MSYNKTKIAVLDPKTWYNKAAKIYKTFHKGLASYDKGLFQRFLPRSVRDAVILDIGSGDARLHTHFADKWIEKYIWFDCAELLLKRAPSRVERVIGDIEDTWPFEDGSIDVALCFFVLLHVRDIHHLMSEAKRVLKPTGNLIILHNFQRREYVYELPNDTFKIQDYHWKQSDVKTAAEEAGFHVEQILLEEKGTDIGILYSMSSI